VHQLLKALVAYNFSRRLRALARLVADAVEGHRGAACGAVCWCTGHASCCAVCGGKRASVCARWQDVECTIHMAANRAHALHAGACGKIFTKGQASQNLPASCPLATIVLHIENTRKHSRVRNIVYPLFYDATLRLWLLLALPAPPPPPLSMNSRLRRGCQRCT
jgi:hypothetical protein